MLCESFLLRNSHKLSHWLGAFRRKCEASVYLGDVLDGFIFQHGIRHLGEIEHARSLLGLQGVS